MSGARPDRSSRAAYERACRSIPGGVNSPVRSFRSVGLTPFFVASANGPHLVDVDGNRYVDFVMSWGPLLFGHAAPRVVEAVERAVRRGTSYGAPTVAEVELAERLRAAMPSLEKVRLVNSGTEATLSAVRLARGFTGRDLIVKFAGHYHGHHDALLVSAGSGGATFSVPDSAGVPSGVAALTRVLPFNSPGAVRSLFAAEGGRIAAAIVEPVAGNMGVVPPAAGFLELLREETRRSGALLVFDEVMTGFRVALGGAQSLYGVTPDLTTLGKVIGGGFPLAAYGGRAEVMDRVSPLGPVYQAGTLSGNPVAVAAGIAQLDAILEDPAVYERLEASGDRIERGLLGAAREAGAAVTVNRVGSMLTPFFSASSEPPRVTDFDSARECDSAAYAAFFRGLLDRGFFLPPSAFEALFLSTAHGEDEIGRFLAAAAEALSRPLDSGSGR